MDNSNFLWRSKARATAWCDIAYNAVGLTLLLILTGMMFSGKLKQVAGYRVDIMYWPYFPILMIFQGILLLGAINLILYTENFVEVDKSVRPVYCWFIINLIDLFVTSCTLAVLKLWVAVPVSVLIRVLFICVGYNFTNELSTFLKTKREGFV